MDIVGFGRRTIGHRCRKDRVFRDPCLHCALPILKLGIRSRILREFTSGVASIYPIECIVDLTIHALLDPIGRGEICREFPRSAVYGDCLLYRPFPVQNTLAGRDGFRGGEFFQGLSRERLFHKAVPNRRCNDRSRRGNPARFRFSRRPDAHRASMASAFRKPSHGLNYHLRY